MALEKEKKKERGYLAFVQVIGAGKKAKPVLVREHNDNAGNLSLSL